MKISKVAAAERRERLRRALQRVPGLELWSKKECRKALKAPFPSALVAGRTSKSIVVACNQEDRTRTKSKFELDTWAFALRSVNSDVSVIEFLVQRTEGPDAENALKETKWFFLLIRRLSYLCMRSESVKFRLGILNPDSSITTVPIPSWRQVLAEGESLHIYSPGELRKRGKKSKRDAEDREQNRIMDSFGASGLVAFKEFPVSMKGRGLRGNSSALRIDILYRNLSDSLTHVELKAGKNKELDVCAQSLDYHVYLIQVRSRIGADWKEFQNIQTIRPLVLHEMEHPLLNAVANQYRSMGFPVEVREKGSDGSYGGLLVS